MATPYSVIYEKFLNRIEDFKLADLPINDLTEMCHDWMLSAIAKFRKCKNDLKDRDDDNSKANGILMLIGLIFLILSPIFGKLMQLAISRKREYLADATAIEFTRNPDGLISALQKISGDPNELKVANNATENMYIASPFRGKKSSSSLWSTHPSIEDRVEALRNLK